MTTEKTETSPVWPAGVIEAEPLNNLSDRGSLHMRVSIGDHAQDVRRNGAMTRVSGGEPHWK